MREIKFRAWDVESKSMAFVETLHLGEKIKPQIENCDWDWYKRDYQLMQYTGLKDVNGVEIFEGDIIKFTNCIDEVYEEIGTVVFDLDECGYKAQYSKGSTVHCIYLISPKVFSDRFHEVIYEIIGNVYESPELLK